VFFVLEKGLNPPVQTYPDALWWAAMNTTTVGSNIIAVTRLGQVMSVILAASGMMMFPIFTVYVTNLVKDSRRKAV
jgi:voltage-gated potassium channel Kch